MPHNIRATLALAASCAGWGFSFVLLKDFDAGLARAIGDVPWTIAAWGVAARFGLAALALLALPGVRRALIAPGAWAVWRDAGIVALPSAFGYGLQFAGMRGVDAGTNAFLTSLYTPLTPLFAWLLFRAVPPGAVIGAVPVAVLGVALITRGSGGELPAIVAADPFVLATTETAAPAGPGFHEALVLLGAVCWALQILAIDRCARRHAAMPFSAALFAWIGGAWCVVLALSVTAEGVSPARLVAPLGDVFLLRGLALLVVVCTLVVMIVINHFQPMIDPSRAALVYTAEPAFAAVFAAALHDEPFSGPKLWGCGLLLGANLLVELPALWRRRDRPTAPGVDSVQPAP